MKNFNLTGFAMHLFQTVPLLINYSYPVTPQEHTKPEYNKTELGFLKQTMRHSYKERFKNDDSL